MTNTTDITERQPLDPSIACGYDVLSVLTDETTALDVLLLRCRATMLLASAGEVGHLGRASADLDAAAEALDLVSSRRVETIERAAATWGGTAGSADELVGLAPEEFREIIGSQIAVQRSLLAEAGEAIEVAGSLSRRSLDVLSRRRVQLETAPRPVVYGAPPQAPPTAVVERA